jgi:NAD(P)-dependent dehydrogenase (short-subunit alcohol dehydrogenase family)
MPVYAVTGASGHVGRYAVHQLLAGGILLGAQWHRPRRVRRGSLQQSLRERGQAVTSARAGAASYQQGPTYFGRNDG